MVSPKYCKFYTKVALNHVDNIENIASNNVRFHFVGFTCRVESIIVTAGHGQYMAHVVQFLLHRNEPGVALADVGEK